jgi:hypothetical protein
LSREVGLWALCSRSCEDVSDRPLQNVHYAIQNCLMLCTAGPCSDFYTVLLLFESNDTARLERKLWKQSQEVQVTKLVPREKGSKTKSKVE